MNSRFFNPLDDVLALFPPTSRRRVEILIEKAMRRELRGNLRRTRSKLGDRGTQKLVQAARSYVADQLIAAISLRGSAPRGTPSLKQKAPKSGGGRTFHFAHSSVSRTSKPDGMTDRGGGSPASKDGKQSLGCATSTRVPKAGRAAAHMRYVERPDAIERGSPERTVEVTAMPAEEVGRGQSRNGSDASLRIVDNSWDRSPSDYTATVASGASAGQAYVERTAKLEAVEQTVLSFGTIGDTADERQQFWDKLEAHERKANARIQERLIIELPHEATGEQRHEMMRLFARQFEQRGLPYWVAMHAPGRSNDARNFHAHVVYTSRRARKMEDPRSGIVVWDFEIVEEYRTASRNKKLRHPFRQDRHPDMRRIDAVPMLRRAFAEAVNEVLVRDDVRDVTGERVRYDPRSYKDMGLDVVPMRAVHRIVADKLRDGESTVLDADHTREMIEAELREVRRQRDRQLHELEHIRVTIEAWARVPIDRRVAARLPTTLRPKGGATPSASGIRRAGAALLRARHVAYVQDVVHRSAQLTLDRIVEATSPESLDKRVAWRFASTPPQPPPDPEVAAALHVEALTARRAFETERGVIGRQLKLHLHRSAKLWSAAISTSTILQKQREYEEGRVRRARSQRIRVSSSTSMSGPAMPAEVERDHATDMSLAVPRDPSPALESQAATIDVGSAVSIATPNGQAPSKSRDEVQERSIAPALPTSDVPSGGRAERNTPSESPISVGISSALTSGPTQGAGSVTAPGAEPAAEPTPVQQTGETQQASLKEIADIFHRFVLPTGGRAELRRRLDTVMSSLRTIQDPEHRLAAILELGQGGGTTRAVLDAIQPDERIMLAAAMAVDGARSKSAEDVVETIIATARTLRSSREGSDGPGAGSLPDEVRRGDRDEVAPVDPGPVDPTRTGQQPVGPALSAELPEPEEDEEKAKRERRADMQKRRRAILAQRAKDRGARGR